MSRLVDAFAAAATAGRPAAGAGSGQLWGEVESMLDVYTRGAAPARAPPPPPPAPQQQPQQPHAMQQQPPAPAPAPQWPPRAGAGDAAGGGAAPPAAAQRRPLQPQPQPQVGQTVYERGVQLKRRSQEAARQLREDRERKEAEECTFAPVIKRIAPRHSTDLSFESTAVQDRLWLNWQGREKRLQQLRAKRESEAAQECSFCPTVNKPSSADGSGNSPPRGYLADGCFDRLYRAAQQHQQGRRSTAASLLLSDTIPQHSSRRRRSRSSADRRQSGDSAGGLTADEISKAQSELEQLDEMLQARLGTRARLPERAAAGISGGIAGGGAFVNSNYRGDSDSDGGPEAGRRAGAAAADAPVDPSVLGFLQRQNEHEERRLQRLEQAEARAAHPHRPTITAPPSGCSAAGSARRDRGGERLSEQAAGRQEFRVRRLCAAVAAQRHEAAAQLRELGQVLRTATAEGSLPADAAAPLRAELAALNQCMQAEDDEEGLAAAAVGQSSSALVTRPAPELRPAAEAPPRAAAEAAAALGRLFSEARRAVDRCEPPPPGPGGGGFAVGYSQVLSAWLRSLGRAREGLGELRGRAERLRRRLTAAEPAAAAPRTQRGTSSPPRPSGRLSAQAGVAADARPTSELELRRGEALLVRRLPQGRWTGATFDHLDSAGVWVIEEGKTRCCVKPFVATEQFVRRAPAPPLTAAEIPPESRAAWPAAPSHYDPKVLAEGYTAKLREEEERRQRERADLKRQKEEQEAAQCTHRPATRVAPEYVTRIAHSMALLRGQRERPGGASF